ncbi:MAG: cytochrome P450 [Vicinamibacterales bacterium]
MPALEEFLRDPHPFFHRARAVSPVLRTELFGIDGWLVTGFEEAEAILKDPRFAKDQWRLRGAEHPPDFPARYIPAYRVVTRMMLFQDPPAHTRMRHLVVKAFAPTMASKLRPEIERACAALLDARAGQATHELVGDFAGPLPVGVIAALLGVPPEDGPRFRRWSAEFVRLIDLTADPEVWEHAGAAIAEFEEYIQALVEEKRARPCDDLLSALVAVEEQGTMLTLDELVSTCMVLLIAGHETTTNLIGSGYFRLLQHPDQYAALASDPALMPGAIEEMLRFEPPGLITSRWPAEDVTFRGHEMRRGEIVMLAIGAANRDPRVVSDPDVFDIRRKPNRHLSFGSGVHYCLGAALGRLETEIAIRALMRRLERPELLADPQPRTSVVIHGLARLDVRATVTQSATRAGSAAPA